MLLLNIMSKSKTLSSLSCKTMPRHLKNQQDYEACIEVLNNLQSNAQYIKANSNPTNIHNEDKLKEVRKYFLRTGLTFENLDTLSVIHVAGTKGKGTTCAFSESILRHHGYNTGFFSSPHLLEVRERIRINGRPIEKEDFCAYFWKIYSKLDELKNDEYDMPLYFRFLTIMALSIFIEKKVDVAIVEVGIGGEYDCTNILRKVPVVGITSLGIDHTSLLGNTIESIAWNKAGIMKKDCKAFTVPQPEAAFKVLQDRSVEKGCELEVVEPLQFKFPENSQCLSHILNLNASLAVALCKNWLKIRHNNNNLDQLMSNEITENAIAKCVWPGRFQVKHDKNITYYLDGAHTLESIEVCSDWFKNTTKMSKNKKVLLFNITGGRNATNMFKHLQECKFDIVLFTTNNATKFEKSDELLKNCEKNKKLWLTLDEENVRKTDVVRVFATVLECITFLHKYVDHHDLLVTGSLHLVGAVLSIIDPNLGDAGN